MCDNCRCRQEAFKRMRIKKLPQVLVLHLKRFKYAERINQYAKLRYSVAFPFHLKIPNTSEETEDPGRATIFLLWSCTLERVLAGVTMLLV
eukprot:TRINITY_DN3693_c0_g1_i1.p1 TRINITY_DN3693_c0_g1~~TRINITY_DN3693_c0_g1_i1.p1  ORF type:complete len:91 (+),score=6.81 TRINITY_DN3693_c0_g1_i1:115-387(+)